MTSVFQNSLEIVTAVQGLREAFRRKSICKQQPFAFTLRSCVCDNLLYHLAHHTTNSSAPLIAVEAHDLYNLEEQPDRLTHFPTNVIL